MPDAVPIVPTLIIERETGEQPVAFSPARSLRHILDTTECRVRSGCSGTGACGLCRVRIIAGEVGAPTPNERVHLDESELSRGMRLACQLIPTHDLRVEILSPAPRSVWRSLPGGERPRRDVHQGQGQGLLPRVHRPLGAAVDLGTTHLSLSLHDLASGRRLAGCYGLNPQMSVGSEIITRLMAAAESPERAQALSQQVVDAIGEGLWDIAAREGLDLRRLVRLALVGNTAMLALLAGRNADLLLQPSHWMSAIDCRAHRQSAWAHAWGIHPQARIEVMPPLGGFVGSDLLAGVMTTGLTASAASGLFIDFGTNSEIALWDGHELWVTAAAGGPAFEGSGMHSGLPAEPGAIHRVEARDRRLEYAVIGGCAPRGLCGSGLVDLVAELVGSGELDARGRLAPTIPSEGFPLARGERDIRLTNGDVDLFQRAKAAVGAGIQILLAMADRRDADLERLCVAGAFGSALNIRHAQAIGLLPSIDPARIEPWGNTALAGCEDALQSTLVVERLERLGTRAKLINLSQCPDFDERFLENLYLQPLVRD